MSPNAARHLDASGSRPVQAASASAASRSTSRSTASSDFTATGESGKAASLDQSLAAEQAFPVPRPLRRPSQSGRYQERPERHEVAGVTMSQRPVDTLSCDDPPARLP